MILSLKNYKQLGRLAAPFIALLLTSCKSVDVETFDPHQVVAFSHVRLIDGQGGAPVDDAVLVIKDGVILAAGPSDSIEIPDDAKVVNHKGKSIMPALIANHSHIGSVDGMKVSAKNYNRENILRQLRQYEKFGVGTVNALGMNADLFYPLRNELHAGLAPGADLFGADRGIGVPKGAPPIAAEFDKVNLERPTNAREVRQFVKQMRARGTDFIKIWYDDFLGTVPKMKPEFYRAAIDESKKLGLPVMAHVYYLDDAKKLVHAGVDVLAHGVRTGAVDTDFANLMKSKNVAYIATLGVDESFYIFGEHPEWAKDEFFRSALQPEVLAEIENASKMKALLSNPTVDTRKAAVKMNQKNLKVIWDAGVLVGFGTDSGANPWRIPGFAEHRELELMVEAGLTPLQAIQAATVNAAKVMKLSDRGIIAAGKRADFIVLDADPSENILNSRKINSVWTRGRLVN